MSDYKRVAKGLLYFTFTFGLCNCAIFLVLFAIAQINTISTDMHMKSICWNPSKKMSLNAIFEDMTENDFDVLKKKRGDGYTVKKRPRLTMTIL